MIQCECAPLLDDDTGPIGHGGIGAIHGQVAAADNSDRAFDRLVVSPSHIRPNHSLCPIGRGSREVTQHSCRNHQEYLQRGHASHDANDSHSHE